MTTITQQKGLASSTPNGLKRWLVSKLMSYVGSEKRLLKARRKREANRLREGRRHVVEYFHQVDDGYSHLSIQLLAKLKATYDIDLVVHLVPALRDDNFPEPDLLVELAQKDAANIAPYYNLHFPEAESMPDAQSVEVAQKVLCNIDAQQFCTVGVEVSRSLWAGEEMELEEIAEDYGIAAQSELKEKLEHGAQRRAELGHYSGAMFYYEGEWYWGVDRLYHLEHRLRSLNAEKENGSTPIAAQRSIPVQFKSNATNLTLEFYASLRSPYTAVAWEPTIKLAQDSGIKLVVRPVLPMVMRGVPVTLPKAKYIFTDTAREARALGVAYGKFYDPIGEPVMQGYSLYMWASQQGKGNALLGAFLKAAFADGINTNSQSGTRKVVEMAGLNWHEAKCHLKDDSWEKLLENNRLTMYEFGSWGVPSFRLLDAEGNEIISAWGQDRVWLMGQKILENSEQKENVQPT